MLRLKVVILGIIAVLISSTAEAAVLLDRVVAIVNQEVITWSELYREMEAEAVPQLKETNEEERMRIFKESEPLFLDKLIGMRLQLQEAKNMGVRVTNDELQDAIDGIMKKYSMSDEEFKESLKKEGYSFDEYRKKLREQIMVNKIVNSQVRSKIVVDEKEIERYLAQEKTKLDDGEGFVISQIFLQKPEDEGERDRIEEEAAYILEKLADGESFEELAMKYSQDPSAKTGGKIGFIRKKELLGDFKDVVSGLKPGQVSRPFWTERGLHIIRLDEGIAPKDPKDVREEVKEKLTEQLFSKKYEAWVKSLREKAFIEIRL
jgi:peptidyl-prolyl cis-trans isomerase SurA